MQHCALVQTKFVVSHDMLHACYSWSNQKSPASASASVPELRPCAPQVTISTSPHRSRLQHFVAVCKHPSSRDTSATALGHLQLLSLTTSLPSSKVPIHGANPALRRDYPFRRSGVQVTARSCSLLPVFSSGSRNTKLLLGGRLFRLRCTCLCSTNAQKPRQYISEYLGVVVFAEPTPVHTTANSPPPSLAHCSSLEPRHYCLRHLEAVEPPLCSPYSRLHIQPVTLRHCYHGG
jgi:hypothetical protein